jgi:RNA polymerase sigma-70 factor, ECF subfamily
MNRDDPSRVKPRAFGCTGSVQCSRNGQKLANSTLEFSDDSAAPAHRVNVQSAPQLSHVELTTGVRQSMPVTDVLELARAAAGGHRTAQHEVFRMLRSTVHATLYRILGSNRYIEDLVQEAFIEIFRSLSSYRGESKLTTWADRITVRVAYRHFRRRQLVLSDPEVATHAHETPEHQAQAREGVRRLYAVLSQMKPDYRIAFTLFSVDGRSLAEVAAVTGVSVIAAKSRVWRARRILRQAAAKDPVLSCQLAEFSEVA